MREAEAGRGEAVMPAQRDAQGRFKTPGGWLGDAMRQRLNQAGTP